MSDYQYQFRPVTEQPATFDSHPVSSLPDIDKLLLLADVTLYQGLRSALVISSAITHIVRHGPIISLGYLEGRYRDLDSPTYLLAAPRRLVPAGMHPRLIHNGAKAKYMLWICVNGRAEAERTMLQFDLADAEDNRLRLKETGTVRAKRAIK